MQQLPRQPSESFASVVVQLVAAHRRELQAVRERFDAKIAPVRTLREESGLQSCGEVAEELAPDEMNLFAAMGQKLGHSTLPVQSSATMASCKMETGTPHEDSQKRQMSVIFLGQLNLRILLTVQRCSPAALVQSPSPRTESWGPRSEAPALHLPAWGDSVKVAAPESTRPTDEEDVLPAAQLQPVEGSACGKIVSSSERQDSRPEPVTLLVVSAKLCQEDRLARMKEARALPSTPLSACLQPLQPRLGHCRKRRFALTQSFKVDCSDGVSVKCIVQHPMFDTDAGIARNHDDSLQCLFLLGNSDAPRRTTSRVNTANPNWLELVQTSSDPTMQIMLRRFGSLSKTAYTLVQAMLGGFNWGEVSDVLMDIDVNHGFQDRALQGKGCVGGICLVRLRAVTAEPRISPALLLLYVAFTMLAVLNVITGAFVDNALNLASQQRDFQIEKEIESKEQYARQIRALFQMLGKAIKHCEDCEGCMLREHDIKKRTIDDDGSGDVSRKEIREMLEDATLSAYFRVLGFETTDADLLFKLLDVDDSDSEFLDGCGRLKGPARNMDVHAILAECRRMRKALGQKSLGTGGV
eukprot:s561_g4.t1